ncbi:hypothetical protein JCM10212_007146 [Sporobolomyces blumeae]
MPTRTIAVVGGTGRQGGSVVSALLSSTQFNVRVISSNPSGEKAVALDAKYAKEVQDGRLEIVQGNLNDVESLKRAFEGVAGVFASFGGELPEPGEEEYIELVHGRNLVEALKAIDVEHFVYSSLPSIARLSKGEITNVLPFESKAANEALARKELRNVTTVVPGSFFSDLELAVWCIRMQDGTVNFCIPLSGDTIMGWVDEAYDVGVFAAAIFEKGPAVTGGKQYPVNSERVTSNEMAATYTRVTGEPAVRDPLLMSSFRKSLALSGEQAVEAMVSMLRYMETVPEDSHLAYGPGSVSADTVEQDLGVRASTFEEYLERSDFRALPPSTARVAAPLSDECPVAPH